MIVSSGTASLSLTPAHPVLVAVGQHDDVARRRPVPFASVATCDPARAAGDDVEEDHPIRARAQDLRRWLDPVRDS